MKPLAYAIISATGLIRAAFTPSYPDRCVGVLFTCTFAIMAMSAKE